MKRPFSKSQDYLTFLQAYDALATKQSNRHGWAWRTVYVLTWFPLLLLLAAALIFKTTDTYYLREAIFWLGVLLACMHAYHLVTGFQQAWLRNRAAAESLRAIAMRYRARQGEFDGPDRDAALKAAIDTVRQRCEKGQSVGLFAFLSLFRWPRHFRDELPDATTDDIALELTPDDYLNGRIRNQQRWFLRSARHNMKSFLGLQTGMVVVAGLASSWHKLFRFEPIVAAFGSLIGLALIAFRDQADCRSRSVHYLLAYERMCRFEQEWEESAKTNADFKAFVDRVETFLQDEVRAWYASHGGALDRDPSAS